MKALVLAGGSGTRLRPFSYSMPKQLIPIANKPILEHVLDNIRALRITEIGMIVGDSAPAISEAIGDGSRFGVRVSYIRQDEPRGLAHCVRIARRFLGDDDFVMYLGDNVLPDGVTEPAARFRAARPAAQVVAQRVADPRQFGVAELGDDGRVRRLVEKPRHPRSDLALVGVYFFTPAIHDAVAAITPGARGELEITDAIQWLVTRGAEVRVGEYEGFWKDAGRAEDVLECNRRLLGGLATAIAGQVDAASVVGDRVVVEEGARLVGARVEGPVIIGAGSLIENSHVGPNVAIGRDCVVRAGHLSDSIVLDGASIARISGLYGSIIGRCAAIGSSEHAGAYHRLVVGDHTRLEIAA